MNFEHVHKNLMMESNARILSIKTCLHSVLQNELPWYAVKDNIFIKLDFLVEVLTDHGHEELSAHLLHIRELFSGVVNNYLIAKSLVEIEEIQKALLKGPFILSPIEFNGEFSLNISGYFCGEDLFVIS